MKPRIRTLTALSLLIGLLTVVPYAVAQAGDFVLTGSMSETRYLHTATLLNNGMVLIAGSFPGLASAEVYDPVAGTFTATGNMTSARGQHTATLLNNGMVLVTGGTDLPSAELYDPATGIFTPTGSMSACRFGHTATLLNNGKVLITGGYPGLASAEVYDPVAGTFTAAGSMTDSRWQHTATLLNNGKVLIAGGRSGFDWRASAELYDPSTETFTATGNMTSARELHTATLLNSGMVLIAGGYIVWDMLASAELYDPSTETFTATGNMTIARGFHAAALLKNGMVLTAGGYGSGSSGTLARDTAELYDPNIGAFTATGNMTSARAELAAVGLNNGMVLLAGGHTGWGFLASAELYLPSGQPPVANAGLDQTVECEGPAGTSVTLNGSASSDPDGDSLSYTWTGPFGTASGVSPTVTLPYGTSPITLVVNDGTVDSSPDMVDVTIQDTTPPTLTLGQDSITVVLPTASATGASVDVLSASGASATDICCDSGATLSPSGASNYSIGTTTAYITASDCHANTSAGQPFTVNVVYNFSGFLPPIRTDNTSIFRSGRTIPVKFQLTAADGSIVSNATATLLVGKVTDVITGAFEELTPEASGNSNLDNLFRFDPTAGQYIYNLSAAGFSAGTYVLRATLNDGTTHHVYVSIR